MSAQGRGLMFPLWRKWEGHNLESPIKAEPLVGFLKHFVRRETATFSTVRIYKCQFNLALKKEKVSPFLSNKYIYIFKVEKMQTFRIANWRIVVKVKVIKVKVHFSDFSHYNNEGEDPNKKGMKS